MTQDWWDLHYHTVFQGGVPFQDPRLPGALGGGVLDPRLLNASLDCAQAAVSSVRAASPPAGKACRRPRVLVLGCGLSAFAFALADRGKTRVACLEISPELVGRLAALAGSLPRPPRLRLGDITTVARRRRAERP